MTASYSSVRSVAKKNSHRRAINDESPENSGLSIFFVRYQTNIFVAINRYKFQFCFLGTWITGFLDFNGTSLTDNFDSLVLVFQDSRFVFLRIPGISVLRIIGFESIFINHLDNTNIQTSEWCYKSTIALFHNSSFTQNLVKLLFQRSYYSLLFEGI
jgi:hypothetical protein